MGTQHIQGASLVVGQEAVSRRTHTNKYLLFQSCLEVWTLNITLEHINWASKLSQIHPIGLLKSAETSWKILEWNILGCNIAGWNIPILYRKYIDSFRVHFAASYVTLLGWSGCFSITQPDCLRNSFWRRRSEANPNRKDFKVHPGKLPAGTWKPRVWKAKSSEPNLHFWVPC